MFEEFLIFPLCLHYVIGTKHTKSSTKCQICGCVWKQHALDLSLCQKLLGANPCVTPSWTVMPFAPPIWRKEKNLKWFLKLLRTYWGPLNCRKMQSFWKVCYVSFGGCMRVLLAVGNNYVSFFKTFVPITTRIYISDYPCPRPQEHHVFWLWFLSFLWPYKLYFARALCTTWEPVQDVLVRHKYFQHSINMIMLEMITSKFLFIANMMLMTVTLRRIIRIRFTCRYRTSPSLSMIARQTLATAETDGL